MAILCACFRTLWLRAFSIVCESNGQGQVEACARHLLGPRALPLSFDDFYLHLFTIINHNCELNRSAELCESFSKSWNLSVILGAFSSNTITQLTAIHILITNCGFKSKENFFLQQIAAHQDHIKYIKCSECVYGCTQQTLSNS